MYNPTQERIRDSMLDAGRQHRYFLAIADRHQKWHLVLSLVAVLGSILAATVLLSTGDNLYARIASAGMFLLVSAATVAMVVWDFSKNAQVARSAADRLNEVDIELRRLWHFTEEGKNGEAEDLERLERSIDEITRIDIPTDDALNKRCNTEAWEVVESFYPARTGEASAEAARAKATST